MIELPMPDRIKQWKMQQAVSNKGAKNGLNGGRLQYGDLQYSSCRGSSAVPKPNDGGVS